MVEEMVDTARVDLSDAVQHHAFMMQGGSGYLMSGKINAQSRLESCWEIKFPMVHELVQNIVMHENAL